MKWTVFWCEKRKKMTVCEVVDYQLLPFSLHFSLLLKRCFLVVTCGIWDCHLLCLRPSLATSESVRCYMWQPQKPQVTNWLHKSWEGRVLFSFFPTYFRTRMKVYVDVILLSKMTKIKAVFTLYDHAFLITTLHFFS